MADITIANLFYAGAEAKAGYVPIGPLYITAALEEHDYEVDFRDYQVAAGGFEDPMDPRSVGSFLDDSADILGIGCAGELLPLALVAVERFKEKYPHKTVIMGGIGPAGSANEIIQRFPTVDVVALGEGERTVAGLMEWIITGNMPEKKVEGIVYRKNGEVIAVPPGPRITRPDSLPFPAYHQVGVDHYSHAGIYSARGCPYQCTFCDVAPFWGQGYHSRSVENIVDEIQLLVDRYQRRFFDIMDDIFVLDRERAVAFCREIKRRRLDIEWACCGRIDLMDEELMREMAECGCTWIFYGIESGADRVLKVIKKGFTVSEARRVITLSRRYFQVVVSLMWGFPNEGLEDFAGTLRVIDFLRDLQCGVDLYLLVPLPFSSLFAEYSHNLVMAPETIRRVFGGHAREMEGFVRRNPGVSRWYYRYPTPHFEAKYEIVEHLELPQ